MGEVGHVGERNFVFNAVALIIKLYSVYLQYNMKPYMMPESNTLLSKLRYVLELYYTISTKVTTFMHL